MSVDQTGRREFLVSIAIGINGFGRIGRTLMRIVGASADTGITVAAINDVAPVERLAVRAQTR
jgi:glyceraldehyde 3-phosphate dehydrogenase